MSNEPDSTPPVRRIDRILAFTSIGILAAAIGCFIAVIVAGSMGVEEYGGIWPVVFAVQLYGPIVAFILLLIVLITSFVRRGRANRQ